MKGLKYSPDVGKGGLTEIQEKAWVHHQAKGLKMVTVRIKCTKKFIIFSPLTFCFVQKILAPCHLSWIQEMKLILLQQNRLFREVVAAPEPTCILATDQQLADPARFCCAPRPYNAILGIDPTFNLGISMSLVLCIVTVA